MELISGSHRPRQKRSYLIGLLAGAVCICADFSLALETRWIPAAASNPGLHGTMWTSDLWLYSQVNDADLTVTATFFAVQTGSTNPPQATIVLPPSVPVEILDAVAVLFGENRPGSIRLEAEHPFFAKSRTVNSGGDSGAYGQGIPAYPPDDAARGYSILGASNRPGSDGIRTNIGIANTSATTTTLNIGARDPDTLDIYGVAAVDIGPYGWFQADLFDLLGVSDETIELADVSVYPSAFNLVYISRVENLSGDGTFIFGSSGPSVSIIGNDPRQYEVRTTLTFDPTATIDWFRWPGEGGENWTRHPATGFETDTVVLGVPNEYCVEVIGQAGQNLTRVTVEISVREPGGDWSGGSSSYSTLGHQPINQEFCQSIE